MGQLKSKRHSSWSRKKLKKMKNFFRVKSLFVSGGHNVDCLVSDGCYTDVTPLWLAVQYGDPDLTKLFIQLGANVNLACGSLNMTPLHVAAYHCHVELVQILLEAGANTKVMDNWNYSPLMYTVIHPDPFTVNTLIQLFVNAGCDVNYGATISHIECQPQDYRTLDIPQLSSQYIDSHVTYVREPLGAVSGTALHLAVQNPHLPNESVELLLQAGADLNTRNLHGQTPIMGAMLDTYYDYHRLVKSHAELLARCGARLDVTDLRGWTPVHYAAQRGSVAGMDLLLSAGADGDACGIMLESPLWLLLAQGWQEATMYLIRSGCHVEHVMHSMTIQHINPNATLCRFGPILPLEFALSNRYYSIAKLVVCMGYTSLDQALLQQLRTEGSQLAEFLSYLDLHLQSSRHVPSLRSTCRTLIRQTLKSAILVKLDKMGLPKPIKDFLAFNDL